VRRSGYLCIADSDHQHVREVNTSGTMSTVSGNGTVGYGGARPVVALDGIDVGVMIVGGGFAVDDVIVSCSLAERCMISCGAAAASMLRCALAMGGVMV
jgi:hypothetical protein